MLSTSTPCCSCVCVLRQLQLRFPRICLRFTNGEISQDGHRFDEKPLMKEALELVSRS